MKYHYVYRITNTPIVSIPKRSFCFRSIGLKRFGTASPSTFIPQIMPGLKRIKPVIFVILVGMH